ncbi:S26 family signal peptidase [Planomonospora algeriensis]
MTGPLALVLVLVPLAAGAATLLWARRNLMVTEVLGTSMHPTHRHGDRVLVRRLPAGRLRPGDVVVADVAIDRERLTAFAAGEVAPWERHDPHARPARVGGRHGADPRPRGPVLRRVVKRVAAVPGDPVPASVPRRPGEVSVPEGFLVLLGDNPARSLDSRHLGRIPAAGVIGRVVRPIASARTRPGRPPRHGSEASQAEAVHEVR